MGLSASNRKSTKSYTKPFGESNTRQTKGSPMNRKSPSQCKTKSITQRPSTAALKKSKPQKSARGVKRPPTAVVRNKPVTKPRGTGKKTQKG